MAFPRLKKRNYPLYVAWREVCHILGSLFLLGLSFTLTPYTTYDIPLIVFSVLTVWMIYQEAYLHPKKYCQKPWKGILDVFSWITPFIFYFVRFGFLYVIRLMPFLFYFFD